MSRHRWPPPGLLPLTGLLAFGLIWTARARVDRPLLWPLDGPAAVAAAGRDPAERLGLRIDLNTATADELTVLPGVGPRLAELIVTDRLTHGPFGSWRELQRVRRIGPAVAGRVAPYVVVSGDAAAPELDE